MNLRKWSSHAEQIKKFIPSSDQDDQNMVKVLGLIWNRTEDVIQIQGVECERISTKRGVLKIIGSIFDPLGYATPALTLKVKIFLQSLWKEPIEWDEQLDEEKIKTWSEISERLQLIPTIKIPRYVGSCHQVDKTINLLCFCDASSQAYATVIYIHIEDDEGSFSTNLMFSKSRLAPKRVLSLPRLELMGVLIGIRGLRFVLKELQLPNLKCMLWTDSQCVLHWIIAKKPLPVFVQNRVTEIRSMESVHFLYVSSQENPADLATRGNNYS